MRFGLFLLLCFLTGAVCAEPVMHKQHGSVRECRHSVFLGSADIIARINQITGEETPWETWREEGLPLVIWFQDPDGFDNYLYCDDQGRSWADRR